MLHGLYVAPFGDLADPLRLADIAVQAEGTGWDGFFVWDHVMTYRDVDVADAWIALTTVALATKTVRLGALVTPLARRRPWDVARQVAMIDRLSRGRMVLGAGLGGDSRRELSAFGEERDPRARARMLDEALELVDALWSGKAVTRDGASFPVHEARLRPTPLQRPRPPIWLGCVWPHKAPLRRAARYDGVFPVNHRGPMRGGDVRAILETIAEHRAPDAGPFDVMIVNQERAAPKRLAELAEAGTTWWVQGFGESPRAKEVRAAAAAGPPQ
jgi:alkanesulfonate monooxygenase SsuD/methylene tetrahydromethanopterin reductase-like flavin-dependent oxidoreductase (luciferase family)